MLTTLFVQIIIMSAVLGVISHNPHVIDSLTSETPVSLLETLLDQIYKNSSKPLEANITGILQPKLDKLYRKPLLEFIEEKISQTEAPENEKIPFVITFTNNILPKSIGSNEKKSFHGSHRQITAARERDLTTENNDELTSFKLDKALKVAEKEYFKENPNLENNGTKKGGNEAASKKYSKMQHESWRKFQYGSGNLRLNSLRSSGMKTSNDFTEKQMKEERRRGEEENFQTTEETWSNLKTPNKVKKQKVEGEYEVSQQAFKELTQLDKALQLLAKVLEHPSYISRSTSAEANKTDDNSELTSKNNTTALVSQVLVDSVKLLNTSNLKGITDHFKSDSSDDGNWFEPLLKSVSNLKENNRTSAGDNSKDSAITDKKIELFQNSFLYRKILFSILSSYPILANWSQAVSAPSFANRSGIFRSQHLQDLSSDSSYHLSKSLLEPSNTKQKELQKQEHGKKDDERDSSSMDGGCSEDTKPETSHSILLNDTASKWEAEKTLLLPNVRSPKHHDQTNLQQTRCSDSDKTESTVETTERPKLDAITCIIPRLNTSIYYGYIPELVNKEPKTGFGKFFNKRNKKKKVSPCTSTTHLCTSTTRLCTSTTQLCSSTTQLGKTSECSCTSTTHSCTTTECSCDPSTAAPCRTSQSEKDLTHPDESIQPFQPSTPTKWKMRHEPGHKTNHEQKEDKELYDEGINKILEDISTKMCLPDMINKLLDVLNQNKTNFSSAEHPIPEESNYQDLDCNNKQGSLNDYTATAPELARKESKKRRAKQSHSITRDDEEMTRLRKHFPGNYRDKNSHQSNQRRLKSEGIGNGDLSNLLFFIGVNKGQNREEKAKSQENYYDLAYMKSHR